MKHMIIENKELRRKMDKAGLQHFALAKDRDYFYIVANKGATEEEEFMAIWSESIGVYAFNRQSVDQWIKDIQDTLAEARRVHSDWFNRGKDPNWCSGSCHMSIEDYDKDIKNKKEAE